MAEKLTKEAFIKNLANQISEMPANEQGVKIFKLEKPSPEQVRWAMEMGDYVIDNTATAKFIMDDNTKDVDKRVKAALEDVTKNKFPEKSANRAALSVGKRDISIAVIGNENVQSALESYIQKNFDDSYVAPEYNLGKTDAVGASAIAESSAKDSKALDGLFDLSKPISGSKPTEDQIKATEQLFSGEPKTGKYSSDLAEAFTDKPKVNTNPSLKPSNDLDNVEGVGTPWKPSEKDVKDMFGDNATPGTSAPITDNGGIITDPETLKMFYELPIPSNKKYLEDKAIGEELFENDGSTAEIKTSPKTLPQVPGLQLDPFKPVQPKPQQPNSPQMPEGYIEPEGASAAIALSNGLSDQAVQKLSGMATKAAKQKISAALGLADMASTGAENIFDKVDFEKLKQTSKAMQWAAENPKLPPALDADLAGRPGKPARLTEDFIRAETFDAQQAAAQQLDKQNPEAPATPGLSDKAIQALGGMAREAVNDKIAVAADLADKLATATGVKGVIDAIDIEKLKQAAQAPQVPEVKPEQQAAMPTEQKPAEKPAEPAKSEEKQSAPQAAEPYAKQLSPEMKRALAALELLDLGRLQVNGTVAQGKDGTIHHTELYVVQQSGLAPGYVDALDLGRDGKLTTEEVAQVLKTYNEEAAKSGKPGIKADAEAITKIMNNDWKAVPPVPMPVQSTKLKR